LILLIDNYDSFVFNLARYFQRLGQATLVMRNSEVAVDEARAMRPGAIVLSPGPCTPKEAGCCLDVVRELHTEFPILGICLGHQAIAKALGGRVIRASEPIHGRAALVRHDGRGIFAGLPQTFAAGRYHSLVVDEAKLPACLEVSARAKDGTIMALRHREWPVVGLQFHPESILTEGGYPLLAAFLGQIGLGVTSVVPGEQDELTPQ
jgi:anthranilate synthase/aminodeoxychorismate synthase-like glutamine amidotransferase